MSQRDLPILFSGPMVRANLRGTKTNTRRLVTVRGGHVEEIERWAHAGGRLWDGAVYGEGGVAARLCTVRCPYGEPGDRLWVRETFASERQEQVGTGAVRWVAPGGRIGALYQATAKEDDAPFVGFIGRWRHSIHMPRCLARLHLEVSSVRIERLQAISREDAIAEGIEERPEPLDGSRAFYLYDGRPHWTADPIESFRTLWDSINGARVPWSANPWVWVVSYRRIDR